MKIKLVESRSPFDPGDRVWIFLEEKGYTGTPVTFHEVAGYVDATAHLPAEAVLDCFDLPKNVRDGVYEEGGYGDYDMFAPEFDVYGPDDDGDCKLETANEEAVAARLLKEIMFSTLCAFMGKGYWPFGPTSDFPEELPEGFFDKLAADPEAQARMEDHGCTIDDLRRFAAQCEDKGTIHKLAARLAKFNNTYGELVW